MEKSVGKTKRELKVRTAEHRSSIRCKHLTYLVGAHCTEANHHISSLRNIGIEKVNLPRCDGDSSLLLRWEVLRLKSMAPLGVNVEFDLTPFL